MKRVYDIDCCKMLSRVLVAAASIIHRYAV